MYIIFSCKPHTLSEESSLLLITLSLLLKPSQKIHYMNFSNRLVYEDKWDLHKFYSWNVTRQRYQWCGLPRGCFMALVSQDLVLQPQTPISVGGCWAKQQQQQPCLQCWWTWDDKKDEIRKTLDYWAHRMAHISSMSLKLLNSLVSAPNSLNQSISHHPIFCM